MARARAYPFSSVGGVVSIADFPLADREVLSGEDALPVWWNEKQLTLKRIACSAIWLMV